MNRRTICGVQLLITFFVSSCSTNNSNQIIKVITQPPVIIYETVIVTQECAIQNTLVPTEGTTQPIITSQPLLSVTPNTPPYYPNTSQPTDFPGLHELTIFPRPDKVSLAIQSMSGGSSQLAQTYKFDSNTVSQSEILEFFVTNMPIYGWTLTTTRTDDHGCNILSFEPTKAYLTQFFGVSYVSICESYYLLQPNLLSSTGSIKDWEEFLQ